MHMEFGGHDHLENNFYSEHIWVLTNRGAYSCDCVLLYTLTLHLPLHPLTIKRKRQEREEEAFLTIDLSLPWFISLFAESKIKQEKGKEVRKEAMGFLENCHEGFSSPS